jgi:gluconate 2-dehydrogenase gamma chain
MLDRRQLLAYAISLVGASSTGAMTAYAATGSAGAPEHYFSAPRRALLDTVADVMIPRTDTPGALDVGAPAYMDRMMARWASQETKAAFDAILDAIDVQASAAHGRRFVMLEAAAQTSVLRAYDAASLADPTGPYGRFKDLLMTTFFLSEPGATVVLRNEEVPGPWRGDIPLSDVGRAWAY